MTKTIEQRNPYAEVPPDQLHRTTIQVPSSAIARLKQVEPKTGVLQTTINVLFDKLTHELDRTGRLNWDPDEFWNALESAQLVLPEYKPSYGGRSTAVQPPAGSVTYRPQEASGGDDRRRAIAVARDAERRQEPSDAASAPAGSGRGSRGKRKRGEGDQQ